MPWRYPGELLESDDALSCIKLKYVYRLQLKYKEVLARI